MGGYLRMLLLVWWSCYSYLVWHLCLSDLQEVPTVVAALLFVSAKLCSSHENKMAFSYGPAVFNETILTFNLFIVPYLMSERVHNLV